MTKPLATQIKQKRPFNSREEEALLGLRMAAARVVAPWAQFLKTTADLSTSQYNILRILRGSTEGLTCGEISERTLARDPDITRLVDRLAKRALVKRIRSQTDRRVVQVEITPKGKDLLRELDPHVMQMPRSLLGHLSQAKLQQLSHLLEELLEGMGSFPLNGIVHERRNAVNYLLQRPSVKRTNPPEKSHNQTPARTPMSPQSLQHPVPTTATRTRTVAVVGVTGTIGSRVANALIASGHHVIGISRNHAVGATWETRTADLRDAGAADRALVGADSIYLTAPEGGDDPLVDEQTIVRNVINAAVRAGVQHIVMHTALRANRGNTGARILDNKTPLEAALRESGVPFSILHPAWYLQNLFAAKPWLDQGMFSMPWPADMVWAATDVDDVARAAAALIASGPTNRAFDIHQPGGVTAAAICRAVQSVTGRDIAYYESTEGTRAAVESYPISDVHKTLYAELYDYFKSDTFLGDPLTIADVIPGFTYGTLEDFVRRNLYPAAAPGIMVNSNEEAAMIVMAIRHKVRDFGAWKAVYDTFPPTAAGALFARVNRATDDANDVLIVSGWNALTDAQAFTTNPELGEKMAAAGVLGAPRFEVYEQVEAIGA